ncbi:MAG: hypothetical protein WD904_10480 [Dehalococcoidia bacterium]
MRRTAICLLALAALFLARSGGSAHADDLLQVTSNINYDVRTGENRVVVTWDLHVVNNDPETVFGDGTVFFYQGLTLPVLSGATDASAESGGASLDLAVADGPGELLDTAKVDFDQDLFFGDTYDFSLSYVIPETRAQALLVTPFYVFVPLITLGDEATVTVTTPTDPVWEVSYESQQCPLDGATLRCAGSDAVYIAGLLEVQQPGAMTSLAFEVPLANGVVGVKLTHFQGEDALAQHQQAVIAGALPLIADVYGFPYPGPSSFNVSHGGRQSVFGYEGLASCRASGCDIVISPGASDYTLVHEVSHLWSGIYTTRWLSEGFAQWVTEEVARLAPEGLLADELVPPPPSTIEFALDDWGNAGSLIGASDSEIARTQAGYDYSLRFLQTLAEEVGADKLREINRTLAESGEPADSRQYMDLVEDVGEINPDALFKVWVFPDSDELLIEERREARNRHSEVSDQLAAEGLSEEPLAPILGLILDWRFSEALAQLDSVDANLDRYFELHEEFRGLALDADAAGLVLPEDIGAAIERWDFLEAEGSLEAAREALSAFGRAREKVAGPRNLWERFGLLGDDPDDELNKAKSDFERGAFERSQEHSQSAIDMVTGASNAAIRRVLLVIGFFASVGILLAVAYWLALARQRRLSER